MHYEINNTYIYTHVHTHTHTNGDDDRTNYLKSKKNALEYY